MQVKEAKRLTAKISYVLFQHWMRIDWAQSLDDHFNRQQTLAVNTAALAKERSDVNHDHGSSNGVEAARAKIALVLAKWVSASAFEEGNGKVDLPGPRDTEQCKKLYAMLQWET